MVVVRIKRKKQSSNKGPDRKEVEKRIKRNRTKPRKPKKIYT